EWEKLAGDMDTDVYAANVMEYFIVFFSSRRRHTRSKRDWSSDVCSSDLIHPRPHRPERRAWEHEGALGAEVLPAPLATRPQPHEAAAGGLERKPGADADPQRAALDGVDGRGRHTMVEHEHPLRSRFTVGS